jgi:hypothetical protein
VLFAALLAIGAAVNFKQEASNLNSQAISFAEGGNVRAWQSRGVTTSSTCTRDEQRVALESALQKSGRRKKT